MKLFKYVLLSLFVLALLATPLAIFATHGGVAGTGAPIPPVPLGFAWFTFSHSHSIEYIAFFGIGLAVGILATFTLLSYRRDVDKRMKSGA